MQASGVPSLPRVRLRRANRCLALAFGLLVALAGPLRAYTPIYAVKKKVALSDLTGNGGTAPMSVTGLNAAGRLVGFYSYTQKARGVTTTSMQVLAWDDATQTLLPVLDSLGGTAQGMATGVSEAGWIGGVCWTSGPGDASGQWGFVWQGGTLTTFAAPDGSDIDTVVAVNNLGQAVGTYYGEAGLKRAFLWDGTASTDLGDLGDPGSDFVWPVSLNDAGQVAGTVYIENSPQHPPPTTAFQWQADSGLSVVDGSGGGGSFANTTATGQNGAGAIIGNYLAPPPKGSRSPVPAGFFGLSNVLTDLGDLGGGGTVPFFLNETGAVTGTGYAADSTLHLFGWPGGGTLADQGPAYLSADDSGFALTGVNQVGELTGFSTDAQGGVHVFVRAGGGSQLYKLEAVAPTAAGFRPDGSDGQRTLINDAGLLAVAGFDQGTGAPEVLLLTNDADGNGLPDGWEVAYFGHTGVDPTATLAWNSGITVLQAYQQGLNPVDFYNGQLPTLTPVSGDKQLGPEGGFVPAPLIVAVTDANQNPLAGAPVTFRVGQGGGQVQPSNTGAPGPSCTVLTDGNGQAKAFFQLPNVANGSSQIAASATSGRQTASATFTETSDDGTGTYRSPFAPSSVVGQRNPDGSEDLTWVNNTDDSTPVVIYQEQADGSWTPLTTLPPGTTSCHIPAP